MQHSSPGGACQLHEEPDQAFAENVELGGDPLRGADLTDRVAWLGDAVEEYQADEIVQLGHRGHVNTLADRIIRSTVWLTDLERQPTVPAGEVPVNCRPTTWQLAARTTIVMSVQLAETRFGRRLQPGGRERATRAIRVERPPVR